MPVHTSQSSFQSSKSSSLQSSSFSQSPASQPQLAFQRLDVYVAARELAAAVHTSAITDAELRDQATRAAKSCFLALAEGLPHESAGQRARYFATAKASLCEAAAAVDLAASIGAVSPAAASAIQALAARVSRMISALRRPTARAG